MIPPSAGRVGALRAASVLVLFGGYEVLSRSGLVYEAMVPSLPSVASSIGAFLGTGAFYANLLRTLSETMLGFGLGLVAGLTCGILLSRVRLLSLVFGPWVHYLAPTPKVIFLPVLMLLFGAEIGGKAALAGISAFFPVAIGTYGAMAVVPPVLIRTARVLNATRWQLITKVYLPAMADAMANNVRFGFGVALIGALLGEIKASNLGLGHLIIKAYNSFQISAMYALLVITFALAMLVNAGITRAVGWLRHPPQWRLPRFRRLEPGMRAGTEAGRSVR